MQKTLDKLIDKNQKLLKIDYFYTLPLFFVYIIDVSSKPKKISSYDILSVDWNFNFSALCKFGYGDISIHHIVMYTPIPNLKWPSIRSFHPYARSLPGVPILYVFCALLQVMYLAIKGLMPINGLKEYKKETIRLK